MNQVIASDMLITEYAVNWKLTDQIYHCVIQVAYDIARPSGVVVKVSWYLVTSDVIAKRAYACMQSDWRVHSICKVIQQHLPRHIFNSELPDTKLCSSR